MRWFVPPAGIGLHWASWIRSLRWDSCHQPTRSSSYQVYIPSSQQVFVVGAMSIQGCMAWWMMGSVCRSAMQRVTSLVELIQQLSTEHGVCNILITVDNSETSHAFSPNILALIKYDL